MSSLKSIVTGLIFSSLLKVQLRALLPYVIYSLISTNQWKHDDTQINVTKYHFFKE